MPLPIVLIEKYLLVLEEYRIKPNPSLNIKL